MTPDRLLALRDYYVGNELVDGYGDVEELIEEIDRTYGTLDAEREARKRDDRKVEAYDAARAVVKREGFSRAEYMLRAETAEAALTEAREALTAILKFENACIGDDDEMHDAIIDIVRIARAALASASEGETA